MPLVVDHVFSIPTVIPKVKSKTIKINVMKKLSFLLILALAGIFLANAAQAQSHNHKQWDPEEQEYFKNLTEEEKEMERIFGPDEKLTLNEQILKWELLLFGWRGYYVEKGEMKTRHTEKDFIAAGYHPYYYQAVLRGLKMTNDSRKTMKEESKRLDKDFDAERSDREFEESFERDIVKGKEFKEMEGKITTLKKQKTERETKNK